MKWTLAASLGSLLLAAPLLALARANPPAPSAAPPPWAPWLPWVFPSAAPAPAQPGAPPPVIPQLPIPSFTPAGAPVVLELFTSDDCPACDSAESEFLRLSATQPVPGARIIPLAFHVQFYGGATSHDPFVLTAGTERQASYDAARGRVYTPQAVVDGDRECLGSEDGTARSLVAAAARQPKVTVDISRSSRQAVAGSLPVSIRYGALGGGRRAVTVVLVVSESNLVVNLPQGETSGGRTPLAPVVRSLSEAGRANPSGGTLEASAPIPPASPRANLTVVALLQDTSNHHIVGVGTMPAGPQ